MSRHCEIDFDKILSEVGDFGKYQRCFYIFLCFGITLVTIPLVVAIVFQTYVPKYRCVIPGCDNFSAPVYHEPFVNFSVPSSDPECRRFWKHNLTTESCRADDFDDNITVSCTEFVFDPSLFTSSFATQWNLTCAFQSMVQLPNTMYFLGVLLGSVVGGIISDRYGRKAALMLSMVLMNLSNYMVVLLRFSLVAVCVMRVLMGMASSCMFQTAFVLTVELVGRRWRVPCGTVINYFTTLGSLVAGGLAYVIRSWVELQLVITAPLVLLLAGFWLCPESIRWLLIQGRTEEAKRDIERMARRNGTTVSPHLLGDYDDQQHDGDSQHSEVEDSSDQTPVVRTPSNETFLDCMRNGVLRRRLVLAVIAWFSVNFAFYGMMIDLPNMPGDFFTNFFITTAAELPGYTFCWLGMDRLGRRATFVVATTLGGVALITSGIIPNSLAVPNAVMLMLGKCGAAAAFAVIYIYTSELFPTSARNTAVGICSMSGRVAAMLAPQLAVLAVYGESIPLLVIGTVVIVSGLATLCLPETVGLPLPETLLDISDTSRSDRCCPVPTSDDTGTERHL